jgi:hypothetical protein
MRNIFVIMLIAICKISESYQLPTSHMTTKPSSSSATVPLRDLVSERPGKSDTKAGRDFARHFAMHPEIASLQSLNQEQYVEKALKLRQTFDDDLKLRERFRKALLHHMENIHSVDQKTVHAVKTRFAVLSHREATARNEAKHREIDPEGYKLKRKLIDTKVTERKRQARLRSKNVLSPIDDNVSKAGVQIGQESSQSTSATSNAQYPSLRDDDILHGGSKFDDTEWWNDSL